MRSSLTFDRRLSCLRHPDVSLAAVEGVEGLVCVVCRAQRAARLEGALKDYVSRHGCAHSDRCWSDELARQLAGLAA